MKFNMGFNLNSDSIKKIKVIIVVTVLVLSLIYFLFTLFTSVIPEPNKKVDMVMDEIVQIERNTKLLQKRIDSEKKKKEEEESWREYKEKIKEREQRAKKIDKEANDAIRKYGIKKVLDLEKNESNLQIRKIANDYRNKDYGTDDDYVEKIYATEFDFNDDGVNEIVWRMPYDPWHHGHPTYFIQKDKNEYKMLFFVNAANAAIIVLNHKTKRYYDAIIPIYDIDRDDDYRILVKLANETN